MKGGGNNMTNTTYENCILREERNLTEMELTTCALKSVDMEMLPMDDICANQGVFLTGNYDDVYDSTGNRTEDVLYSNSYLVGTNVVINNVNWFVKYKKCSKSSVVIAQIGNLDEVLITLLKTTYSLNAKEERRQNVKTKTT